MFDPILLDDPNIKLTFAQKQSCRSSLLLQLLFWPNFKLLCENFSFAGSKIESILPQNPEVPVLETGSSDFARRFQFWKLEVPVLLCFTYFGAHTGDCATGDATRRPSRRTSSSARALSFRVL
jgi:hypothetical protein